MTELENLAGYLLTKINPIIDKVNTQATLQECLDAIRAGVPGAGDDLDKLYNLILDSQDDIIDLETDVATLQGIVSGLVWGNDYHVLSVPGVQVTPGAVLILAASKTFVLTGGDYRFDISCEVGNTSTNSQTVVEVWVGGVLIKSWSKEPKDSSDTLVLTSFLNLGFVPGSPLVEVKFANTGGGIASIENIVVESYKTNVPL